MSAIELLNWHVLAAALSGVFSVWAIFPYIGDILRRGPTKPNAVSFFLWSVCEVIAFIAQVKAGGSWSLVFMGLIIFNTVFIFVLTIIGYGYRKYGWVDLVSLASSVLAIVLWQKTSDPVFAIAFAILADFFAAIPTLVKTYREPHSEHLTGWFLITIAGAFGVLSADPNVANLAFPFYVLIMNGWILGLIYFGRRRLTRTT